MDQTKNPGQQGQPGQDQGQRGQGQEQFDRPNQNANKEPAEGSRENVRGNQPTQNQPGQQGGGISNRPADREQKEQSDVPPRGEDKDEPNA